MASVNVKQEDPGIFHLTVGTEVSAKYRGAFCEAQIKSIKKNVTYKVISKKTGKSCHITEECIRGHLKIGCVVEALLPDQTTWQECMLQSAKDRSSYTVVFDDGDERTLSRGSLCLQGDRHYAKSETLDNLPLTDPENFGTPVLAQKKSRRRRPLDDEYDNESEGHRTPDQDMLKTKEKKRMDGKEYDSSSEDEEDENERRSKYLSDPLMGKVVIVEPHDKRKHWYPGLVVNPLCFESHQKLQDSQIVVRSFKTGKFSKAFRTCVKEISPSNIPAKIDPVWKTIVEDAECWKSTRTVPNRWKMDISDFMNDKSSDENSDSGEDEVKKVTKKTEDGAEASLTSVAKAEAGKSNRDFLEELYKFLDDRGTPVSKPPVLGNKDLDLYLLFRLVQKKQGSYAIHDVKEWKQIYLDLSIPKPNPAAGYNVKTAFQKYLGPYEEYCASWKHIPLQPAKSVAAVKEKKKTQQLLKDVGCKQQTESNKGKESAKGKVPDAGTEGKTRAGRSSPVVSLVMTPRSRRRISESSSASDVTNPIVKSDKKKVVKGTKKNDNKRSSAGPESETDESSKDEKAGKRDTCEKRPAVKGPSEGGVAKKMRRNSTSSVTIQYGVGDRLKVKYGHGPTYKLYDAKVLQAKLPEVLGGQKEYLVHYAGWNARHDEWIPHSFIVGFADDKCNASPTAGTVKTTAKRPKTPIIGRGCRKEDGASPSSACDISSRLEAENDDDLPSFDVKRPRMSTAFRKTQGDDFGKTTAEVNHAFKPYVATNAKSPVALPQSKETTTEDGKDKTEAAAPKENSVKECSQPVDARSTSPNDGSGAPSDGSGASSGASENSNSRESSPQVRRTSARRSKSPARFFCLSGSKRKKDPGSGPNKSRSPTPVDDPRQTKSDVVELKVEVSSANENRCVPVTEDEVTVDTGKNAVKKKARPRGRPKSIKRESSSARPVVKLASQDDSVKETSANSDTVPVIASPVDGKPADPVHVKKEPVDPTRTTDTEKREDDSDSLNDDKNAVQTSEDNLPLEEAANKKERSLSRDNAAPDFETPVVEDPPTIADAPAVAPPDLENDTDQDAELESSDVCPSSALAKSGDDDVVDVAEPVPFPDAANQQAGPQTPPSSSKVLLENTPPTTPERSPNYTSEDQDMEIGKRSPNIDSDTYDMPDEHKDSGGSATSSGCEQAQTNDESMQADEINEDCSGNMVCSLGGSKKKGNRPNRSSNERKGNPRDSSNNDSESDEDHERTRRKSTSKFKQRKKKTKSRPEPPSAPPPLPREELDGMPQDQRIALLQTRMAEMRKIYAQLKQEVANIDRKRKRAKRREREAAEAQSLASKSGSVTSTPTKSMSVKSDAAASSTVDNESVSVIKEESA